MNIYFLQSKKSGHGDYSCATVMATTEEEARLINPDECRIWSEEIH